MDGMTASEIVASLAHTSIPTIIVEGKDDMSLLRLVEKKIGVNVLPCGGRAALLEVFERRDEFKGLQCAFLADRDTWLFDKVPEEYAEIVCTKGYSIENDVLYHTNLSLLLDDGGNSFLNKAKPLLTKWWACELSNYFSNDETHFDTNIHSIIDGLNEKEKVLKLRNPVSVKHEQKYRELINLISSDFELYMRGHQLLDIYKCALKKNVDKEIRGIAVGVFKIAAVLDQSPLLESLLFQINERLSIGRP